MADGRGRAYGFGLSRDAHIAFAAAYIAILVTLSGFGVARFVASLPTRLLAGPGGIAPATPVAFRERPMPDPAYPHRLGFYPRIAIRKHEQGTVYLKALVLESGEVGDVSVLKSSGASELDAAALLAVGDWRYLPAVRKGQPVRAEILVAIHFRLN